MAYYMMPRGDYYRFAIRRAGDYYRGDPSIFGKIFSGVKGFLGLGGGSSKPTVVQVTPPPSNILERIGEFAKEHPIISSAIGYVAGGALGAGVARATSALAPHPQALQRGYHISKRTGKLVKNRRLNPANVHALRRALRRARGFERLARHVLHFTRPGHRVKGFKFARKRKAA
jgi:hypothetical protein